MNCNQYRITEYKIYKTRFNSFQQKNAQKIKKTKTKILNCY